MPLRTIPLVLFFVLLRFRYPKSGLSFEGLGTLLVHIHLQRHLAPVNMEQLGAEATLQHRTICRHPRHSYSILNSHPIIDVVAVVGDHRIPNNQLDQSCRIH
jgi:hypothetical protein